MYSQSIFLHIGKILKVFKIISFKRAIKLEPEQSICGRSQKDGVGKKGLSTYQISDVEDYSESSECFSASKK